MVFVCTCWFICGFCMYNLIGFIIWIADLILRLCGFNYLLSNGLCNISRNVAEFAQRQYMICNFMILISTRLCHDVILVHLLRFAETCVKYFTVSKAADRNIYGFQGERTEINLGWISTITVARFRCVAQEEGNYYQFERIYHY